MVQSLTKIFIDVRNLAISERAFPVREELVGVPDLQTGRLMKRDDYDASVKAFGRLPYAASQTYLELANHYAKDSKKYEAAYAALPKEFFKTLETAGLSTGARDLTAVYDHALNDGKRYNTKVMNVNGRSVVETAAPEAISFNLGSNLYEAGRLAQIFKRGNEGEIAHYLTRNHHVDADTAQQKAKAALASPHLSML